MASDWEKAVCPHGELLQLDARLWQVTGTLPRGPLPRNMVVYRLDDGGLLIHSGIALAENSMRQLEGLGTPRMLIVPNGLHRLDALRYKQRYPQIQVVCPRAAHDKVAQVIQPDAIAEDVLPRLGIACHAIPGFKSNELAYELRLGVGRALVVCDVLFNLERLPGFAGWTVNVIGSTGYFGVTKIGQWFFTSDKSALRDWLGRMAALPDLRVVCVAHGAAVTSQCGERLQQAAARLA